MNIGDAVRVENGRRTGIIVHCEDTKDGQVCVRLNGKRLPLAHRHYTTENVTGTTTGLDSPQCRANQHTDCRDDEPVHCLCSCHKETR